MTTTETKANAELADGGDHDRVSMLSLKADGTPDQTPVVELIGDVEATKAATREQFAQQAVAAVDAKNRDDSDANVKGGSPDKAIDKVRKEHKAAAEAAEKRADAVVDKLTT